MNRYSFRETKVRSDKNKNKASSMKDMSEYDIEYEFIQDNINQLRRSTLKKKMGNLECALEEEQKKIQIPEVLKTIIDLQTYSNIL